MLACLVSVLMGVLAVWLFAPAAFRQLHTPELAAIAGMMILPLATAWAVQADRIAFRRRG
jgi:hypothetical protein